MSPFGNKNKQPASLPKEQARDSPRTAKHGRVKTEAGLLQTAPQSEDAFSFTGAGGHIILISLGPDPGLAKTALLKHLGRVNDEGLQIYFTECDGLAGQLPSHNQSALPENWQKILPSEAEQLLEKMPDACIGFYKPGLRLFPSFFGPFWAKIQNPAPLSSQKHCPATNLRPNGNRQKNILLALDENGLLTKELRFAFDKAGLSVVEVPPKAQTLPLQSIKGNPPDLFFSINFKGIDHYGETFYLLQELGVPVATWCVDNPWHLLSGLRGKFWQEMHIFVTDHSFIKPLKAHGAKQVHHLPLAACPAKIFTQATSKRLQEPEAEIIFVGRSAFPNKNSFFASCKLDDKMLEAALLATEQGEKADFDYWAKTLEISPLWPGQAVRLAGFGAEACSLFWRSKCISQFFDSGIKIYGDNGWKDIFPDNLHNLHPPVDYYTGLAQLYKSARIVLATTSLLLPAGLSQRHFDVWPSGSICLGDFTKGLEIFPKELTEPITFKTPKEAPLKAREILFHASLQKELKKKWQSLIANEHEYIHRINSIYSAIWG